MHSSRMTVFLFSATAIKYSSGRSRSHFVHTSDMDFCCCFLFSVHILYDIRNKVFCHTIIVQLCDDDYGRIIILVGCEILLFFGRIVDAFQFYRALVLLLLLLLFTFFDNSINALLVLYNVYANEMKWINQLWSIFINDVLVLGVFLFCCSMCIFMTILGWEIVFFFGNTSLFGIFYLISVFARTNE